MLIIQAFYLKVIIQKMPKSNNRNFLNIKILSKSLHEFDSCQQILEQYNRIDLYQIAYMIEQDNKRLKEQCRKGLQNTQKQSITLQKMLEEYQNKQVSNEFLKSYDQALDKYLPQLQNNKQALFQIQEENLQLTMKFQQFSKEAVHVQELLRQKLMTQTNQNFQSRGRNSQMDQDELEDILNELYSKVQNTLKTF